MYIHMYSAARQSRGQRLGRASSDAASWQRNGGSDADATRADFCYSATLLRYYSTTPLLYYSTTLLLYYSTALYLFSLH